MRQVLQSYRTGELWLAETPAPALNPEGVVVRTAASVVSAGTERMILDLARKSLAGKAAARPDLVRKVLAKVRTEGVAATIGKVLARLDNPIPLGYSCAGTVSETGAACQGLHIGDRVACAGAGYATHAEFNYVPRNLCARIPPNVSFEDAAFATVGAIALQGIRQTDPRLGENVVVIGLGLIGLLTVQLLKANGCRVLGFDPDAARCSRAAALGADTVCSGEAAAETQAFSAGRGADAVILTAATASNEPLELAAEILRPKGRVVVVGMVGMDVPRDPFYHKELDLRLSMSYGPGRYDADYEERGRDYPFAYVRWTEQRNMEAFLGLVAAGRVTPRELVTQRYDIGNALDTYALLMDKTSAGEVLGIILNYPLAEQAVAPTRRVELPASLATGTTGLGLIGAGAFAKGVLLPAIKATAGAHLVGVCTATGSNAQHTAAKYGAPLATTDPDELLGDERVAAVVIATRHGHHAPLACRALAAGKHVFVEKPLAVTPSQLSDLEHAYSSSAAQRPLLLMAGFNRRFSPHTKALQAAFADRTTPLMIHYRVNAGPLPADSWIRNPEEGGGRVVGEMCHFLDFCEALTGSPAVSVFADSGATGGSSLNSDDAVAATVRYADGSVAVVEYCAFGSTDVPKERVEVSGGGTTAVLNDFRETRFHGKSMQTVKGRQNKGFSEEMAAFVGAVSGGGKPPIALDSLFRTTRVTFAILTSLREGKPVAV